MPRIPRKRPIDYILPFLIMISAGVIVVLSLQLWGALQSSEDENNIYMYLAQGNAKILPWGAGEWERAYNGTRLLQGDSLKTQKGGRMVVELFNDHYIRLDERTEITFSEIEKSGDAYEINLIVRDGNIWLNSDDESESPINFMVRTNHTVIKTVSTIYEVEQSNEAEIIRVIEGNLMADIMIDEEGTKRKVETISIGVGQEAVITQQDFNDYAERKSPSVINALSDDFREGSFYRWNMAEDKNPTDFSIKGSTIDTGLFDEGATEDVSEEVEEGELAKPVITVPSTLTFSTPESSLTIRGTTVAETQKLMVDVESGSDTQTYELNLYVPGNTEWSFAISDVGGTMSPGLNTYSFYALGEGDARSARTILKVNFEGEGGEEDLDLGALTTPTVDSYNGSDSNVVDVDTVKVVGSVEGAEKIVVSGYTLSAFNPGDTTWVYYAKESIGNLDPGENNFTVVAVAPDGAEKSTTFSITYNKSEPVEEEPATPEPSV